MRRPQYVLAVLIALISFPLVQCGSSPPPVLSTAIATKPHKNGVWTTLSYLTNNNPIHAMLLHAGANAYRHLDHSVALRLPDATVWFAGSQGTAAPGQPVTFEHHMEIYQPAYLFNADGSLATRPVIVPSRVASSMQYGAQYTIETSVSGFEIASVVLVRPGATTHSFNTDQRMVALVYTPTATGITLTAPPNGNIAPPGYYMLFIVDTAGVPSVAAFVKVGL